MCLLQPDFLASLFQQNGSQTTGAALGSDDRFGAVAWEPVIAEQQQQQRPTTPETPSMVGSQREQVESTQELNMGETLPTSVADANIFGGNTLNCTLDAMLGAPVAKGLQEPVSSDDSISGWSDDFFTNPELEKLLHPFSSSSAVNSSDMWDFETLLTAQ